MSTALVEPSNEALEYPLSASTRHTGFSLDQSKQTKNLKKDALIVNYDTVVNNYNENVNVKCSSGFYLKVANPGSSVPGKAVSKFGEFSCYQHCEDPLY